jgi:hypothetical protein
MNSLLRGVRPSEGVIATCLDGDTILLNTRTGRYFVLDEVGGRMWNLLLQHGRPESVLVALKVEYDAPEDEVERDLLNLIAELERNGLLSSSS